MNHKNKLPEEIHEKYVSFFKTRNIGTAARALKMDIRTLKNLLETKEATETVMNRINAYIIKTEKQVNKLLHTDDEN